MEALRDALAVQKARSMPFGLLAMESRLMTAAQATEIQRECAKTGASFWALAVERGLLSRQQAMDLIKSQAATRGFVGEILVERGHLPGERLDLLLREYHRERRSQETSVADTIASVPHADVVGPAIARTASVYEGLVGEKAKVESVVAFEMKRPESEYVFFQEVGGVARFVYAFHARSTVLHAIAKAMTDAERVELDGVVLDAVSEFVNVVVGRFCGDMPSGKGVAVPRPPQCEQAGRAGPFPPVAVRVDFESPSGLFSVVLHFETNG
ncbi:MAG: chemotaxis protein CheX [Candidatus Coatesbacteria bacterium]